MIFAPVSGGFLWSQVHSCSPCLPLPCQGPFHIFPFPSCSLSSPLVPMAQARAAMALMLVMPNIPSLDLQDTAAAAARLSQLAHLRKKKLDQDNS